MSVKVESGLWTTKWLSKKASTAFSKDSLVILDAGYVNYAGADAGVTDKPVLGVYEMPAITSGTTGTYLYSNTALIPIQVPIGPATIRCTVTGTLTTSDAGKQMDMSDSVTVNQDGTTYGAVTCVKYISATEGIFSIAKPIYGTVA
jgi:hypothetical protein